MTKIVVIPGGFHPFHAGHLSLYKSAKEAFPDADVYVAATDDQKKRPFPFAIKEKLAKIAGVDTGHFIQVKSPFKAEEITRKYNPNQDILIFVRSEKDKNEQPKPGGTKKDGSPSYFQPYNAKHLQPFSKHGYIAYLPTVEFGPGITSASEIRAMWPTLSTKEKGKLVAQLYPNILEKNNAAKLLANIVKLLDVGMTGTEEISEGFQKDEHNLMYRYDDVSGRLKEAMISNHKERSAHSEGYRESQEAALKAAGIIRSKFDPKKFVQKQNDKWVQVFPYGKPKDETGEQVNEVSAGTALAAAGKRGLRATGKLAKVPIGAALAVASGLGSAAAELPNVSNATRKQWRDLATRAADGTVGLVKKAGTQAGKAVTNLGRAATKALGEANLEPKLAEVNHSKVYRMINALAIACVKGQTPDIRAYVEEQVKNDTFWSDYIDDATRALQMHINNKNQVDYDMPVVAVEQAVEAVAQNIVDYMENPMNFVPGNGVKRGTLHVDTSKLADAVILQAIKKVTGVDITKEDVAKGKDYISEK